MAAQVGQRREIRLAQQPGGQAGHRRQRAEGLDARQLALQLLGHALDQEVAQRHVAQPRLAVADAVEGGDAEALGRQRRAGLVDQRRDGRRHVRQQRHLDEDQRLVGQLRVEEGEAAAVGLQAAAQVVPAVDGVHGLVVDDLFQQLGRRVPVDTAHLQEAGVEPRAEQVQQVGFERHQFGLLRQPLQQRAAHAHQRARCRRACGSGGAAAPGAAARPPASARSGGWRSAVRHRPARPAAPSSGRG